jgi:hypothetical protein
MRKRAYFCLGLPVLLGDAQSDCDFDWTLVVFELDQEFRVHRPGALTHVFLEGLFIEMAASI